MITVYSGAPITLTDIERLYVASTLKQEIMNTRLNCMYFTVIMGGEGIDFFPAIAF